MMISRMFSFMHVIFEVLQYLSKVLKKQSKLTMYNKLYNLLC